MPEEPPDDIADYDVGSAQDALADKSTRSVWVADHERELRWKFDLKERLPVRKKQKIVEDNTTATEEGINISSDYYIDMLEELIVSWSGDDEPESPDLRELLTGAYRGTDDENTVFEDLWDEVPPPFANIPDADLKE
jgi:hypothetical protein